MWTVAGWVQYPTYSSNADRTIGSLVLGERKEQQGLKQDCLNHRTRASLTASHQLQNEQYSILGYYRPPYRVRSCPPCYSCLYEEHSSLGSTTKKRYLNGATNVQTFSVGLTLSWHRNVRRLRESCTDFLPVTTWTRI